MGDDIQIQYKATGFVSQTHILKPSSCKSGEKMAHLPVHWLTKRYLFLQLYTAGQMPKEQ